MLMILIADSSLSCNPAVIEICNILVEINKEISSTVDDVVADLFSEYDRIDFCPIALEGKPMERHCGEGRQRMISQKSP
jgi:hypothetical protein